MVADTRTHPLDPGNPWRSFRYMAWYAVADVSQGGQARVPTLDPCDGGSVDDHIHLYP